MVRTLLGVMRTPFNDYCRSCQMVEEEDNIEHLLCGCKTSYRKRIATIGRGGLDGVSKVAQITVFLNSEQGGSERK